jgi:hypothetical protein
MVHPLVYAYTLLNLCLCENVRIWISASYHEIIPMIPMKDMPPLRKIAYGCPLSYQLELVSEWRTLSEKDPQINLLMVIKTIIYGTKNRIRKVCYVRL